MEEILKLIESYGLSLVLLLGCFYALYKFFWFSVREVKSTFTKRHDIMAEKMDEVKNELAQLKEKLNTILEFIKK
jgi:hypothetical protein|tara:strand:- start:82 stop:306 length:225 start_codon:yes stop_codon:yes gene_type:complete